MRIVLTQIEATYDLELLEQQFYTELGIAIRSYRRSRICRITWPKAEYFAECL
ncbi:hypothetical protein [Pedobacter africanus]|uniref:hypothetical protein n=1 Tax=Pedobacter africanus TaxID=151894 RepID=UPI0013565BD9|nr:hypothetical protein [Pedobacter africanus]